MNKSDALVQFIGQFDTLRSVGHPRQLVEVVGHSEQPRDVLAKLRIIPFEGVPKGRKIDILGQPNA